MFHRLRRQNAKAETLAKTDQRRNKRPRGRSAAGKTPERKGAETRAKAFRPRPKHALPQEKAETATTRMPRRPRSGAAPRGEAPVILETAADANYALLDCGDGEKLERYGPYRIIRPEAQAIWAKRLPPAEWEKADAIFTGDTDEEGLGRWRFPDRPLGETWEMAFDTIAYFGRFTSFRHVGVFPEQAVHWRDMANRIRKADRQIRVLNLFGYTGVASLVAAEAGAHVTHVDASKKAITWARENQELAGLQDRPIRWICEDALKFVQREARRGNAYDIILLDPPAYGRGPAGEVWQLFENLPDMLDGCRDILSEQPVMLTLTAYAIRASFFAMHEIMRDVFTGWRHEGLVQSGELIIREEAGERALSTSLYSRWIAGGTQ
ncbi:class I SAM-dependent rRNA methyltransferase [Oricola thermophila]|uniref:Class I SAM-dependent rRNA methyltransferase n=1 Tax=Oricola thermophila TaxID=2742145 RepID=A0A6N1VFK6_9HYPH|nr:class I SAM-dependent rRNA methyltransferase [Oricola thermophila]QKV19558.1 class I SAM-dependent rRNA methyltransferase [Oricola thermophila]